MTFATMDAGSDGEARRIAADQRARLAGQVLRHHVAVDQHRIGGAGQPQHSTAHGAEGCLQNVDRVDRVDRAEGERNVGGRQSFAKTASRCAGDSSFESAMPFGIFFGLRTTAAATTGPASGPRPASSTPAMQRNPHAEVRAPP
jgi:hypothetical protein